MVMGRGRRRGGNDCAGRAGFQAVSTTAREQAIDRLPGEPAVARSVAFHRFVEPEIGVLLRVAYTLTGSWPDAEDLVQDALIRAWRAAGRFDGAHPRAWLLTILRHTHANSLRRQRPGLMEDLDGQRPAFGAAAAPDPQQRYVDGQLSPPLAAAIATLDPRYRTVLLLVDVNQLRYAEVAELLDVPVGTVMSRLSRARDKVRRQLRRSPTDEGARR